MKASNILQLVLGRLVLILGAVSLWWGGFGTPARAEMPQAVSQFFTAQRADVQALLTSLEHALHHNTERQPGTRGYRFLPPVQSPKGVRVPPQFTVQRLGEKTLEVRSGGNTAKSARLIAETRTNRVRVIALPADYPILRDLLAAFDVHEAVDGPR